jgi:release factor glutamine methyltransferase
MNNTIKSTIAFGSKKLSETSLNLATLESRILLGNVLNIEPNSLLIASENQVITEEEYAKFNEFINRRLAHEPIAYIIKKKEFFGRDFYVNKDVLIPRSDSETLIEAIIDDYSQNHQNIKILELGLGSGCLIITLLLELEGSIAEGIDISEKAIAVAQKNADYYLVGKNRLNISCKDWRDYESKNLFDIIISNPPYISESYQNKELKYEPNLALFALDDGYAKYEELSQILGKLLKDSGSIYLEIGQNMESNVEQMFAERGFYLVDMYKDLAQINRCMKFKKSKSKTQK